MSCPQVIVIPKSECIGNSLASLNYNFAVLREAICNLRLGISIFKDGTEISSNVYGINFIGPGVTVTAANNSIANVTITRPQPGGNTVIQTPTIGVKRLEEQSLNGGGGRNNFFILNDGSLRVCGRNTYGELGVGIADSVTLPRIAGFSPSLELDEYVDKVYTHGNVTFIITTKGRLYGAGFNLHGQLGQGDNILNYPFFRFINVLGETIAPFDFQTNPIPGYAAALQDPVVKIATGTGADSNFITIFALTQSGALYAWGDNSRGQTSIPKSTRNATEIITFPQRIFSTGGTIVDVQSGGNNKATTVFVKDSRGKVFVCGRNQDGQAGINNRVTDITTFVEVQGLPYNYVARNIRVGGNTDNISVWITLSDGSLWAAGFDNNGQVSGNLKKREQQNRFNNAFQPFFDEVDGFLDTEFVDDIVAHADRDCTTVFALIVDGEGYKLKCWGNNTTGQLGLGPIGLLLNSVEPTYNPDWPWLLTGAKVVDAVIAGDGPAKTVLVLDTNNNLWAAGFGRTGLLGRGQLVDSQSFVRVLYNKAFGLPVQIRSTNNDSGYANFVVLLNTGRVLAWGYDSDTSYVAVYAWRRWRYIWYNWPYWTYDTTGAGQLGVDATPQITSLPSLVLISQ